MQAIKSIQDEAQMRQFGQTIADNIVAKTRIYLQGDLGTGKTTLCRAIIQGAGYRERVKSPSFTIVEPYPIQDKLFVHCDFYRVHEPNELDFLGLDDYFNDADLVLVEWPEHAAGVLPEPDVRVALTYADEGRVLTLSAHSPQGETLLQAL